MIINFLVSTNRNAWIAGSKYIFIAEPFLLKELNKREGDYESIEVAPYLWSGELDLKKAGDFVEKKYEIYYQELASRLNKINDSSYEPIFWKKALALDLVRYITSLFQIYELCEQNFNPKLHTCKILSSNSYLVPKDFNKQRELFQYTAFGQEQLFSIYMNLFYPGKFKEFDDVLVFNEKTSRRVNSLMNRFINLTTIKIVNKFRTWYSNIKKKLVYSNRKSVKMGILGCFFSADNLNELIDKGDGSIAVFSAEVKNKVQSIINWHVREELSKVPLDSDRFDTFFYTSLKYCMPKEFLEDFKLLEDYYLSYFSKEPHLKYVVSETWIGDTYGSFALAILNSLGVKHIYNEHNYLSQQFLGNNNKYIYPIVDIFLSLGWFDRIIPNLVRGGSLYEWVYPMKQKKKYEILLIDGLAMTKPPEFNSAYGDSGPAFANRFLAFNESFLSNLNDETLRKITFKTYPIKEWKVASIRPYMASYDYNESELKPYIRKFKSVKDRPLNSKLLIAQSRLVVINYLSTSYIEALLADVPTIILWNRENYLLDPEYADFYEPLVNAGICQTNAKEAADFVKKVSVCPENWWSQPNVQIARRNFIEKNLGSPELSKKYLLDLVLTDNMDY